ncbi:MAG: hypothetical protein WCK01_00700 [Candidatus Uhrbacteria bacterium]
MSTPSKKSSVPKPPQRPWRRASFSFGEEEEAPSSTREREVAKGLESIYMNGGEGDLKSMRHTKRSLALRIFAWVVGSCAVLSALAWAGLILFVPAGPAVGKSIQLSIDGPTVIGLGREETFKIGWENTSYQSIKEVHVRLSLPPSLMVTNVQPEASAENAYDWDLGFVAPGTKGQIVLKGVFLGNLGEKSSIQAVSTYRVFDSGKPEQVLVVNPVTFGETVLAGQFRLPSKAVAGDTVTLEYQVANQGDQGLRGLRIRMKVPKDFTPVMTSSTSFKLVNGGEEWEQILGDFPSHASTSVKLVGQFVAGSVGNVNLQVRAGVPKPDGSFLPLLVTTSTLPILAGDLGLELIVNGSDADRTVQPGDPLRLTIAYRDLSPEPLTDVRLALSFESMFDGISSTGTTALDWKSLSDTGHGATTTNARIQTIRYSKDTVPVFAEVAPQSNGTIDITIPTLAMTSGTRDVVVRVTLEGLMATVGKDKSLRVIKTRPINIRYRSDISLAAEARYFTEEGAPVGYGPLPPVVKKTTDYRVYWTLKKSLHPLENIEVSAVLPGSVAFGATSSTDAGTISYDAATRTVRWKLNRMPEDVKELGANFDVQLTPASIDVNRFADLLSESRFTATDVTIKESIVRSVPPLTTDLQNDEGAKNKGVVKKQ